eukprot:GILJ01009785.1.p1 GENE.GILJ01009785.1~~GILJ01009785.1.p1  ORF type:complete len:235 (+),score=30.32 GILJ01009785.1:137-841(+)
MTTTCIRPLQSCCLSFTLQQGVIILTIIELIGSCLKLALLITNSNDVAPTTLVGTMFLFLLNFKLQILGYLYVSVNLVFALIGLNGALSLHRVRNYVYQIYKFIDCIIQILQMGHLMIFACEMDDAFNEMRPSSEPTPCVNFALQVSAIGLVNLCFAIACLWVVWSLQQQLKLGAVKLRLPRTRSVAYGVRDWKSMIDAATATTSTEASEHYHRMSEDLEAVDESIDESVSSIQ